jgi:hypothetical protein
MYGEFNLCPYLFSIACTLHKVKMRLNQFSQKWLPLPLPPIVKSRDSAVSIATGYGLDDRGVRVRVLLGSRILSSPQHPDWLWDPPSLLSNGYEGVKRPGCKGDHSPPTSAKVKKMWIYTSTPPYTFIV